MKESRDERPVPNDSLSQYEELATATNLGDYLLLYDTASESIMMAELERLPQGPRYKVQTLDRTLQGALGYALSDDPEAALGHDLEWLGRLDHVSPTGLDERLHQGHWIGMTANNLLGEYLRSLAPSELAAIGVESLAPRPRVSYTPGNETILEIEDSRLKVELADIGEGFNGDYNPDDPQDVPLVRFYVYEREGADALACENDMPDNDGWVPVRESSCCTGIPVDSPRHELEEYAQIVFDEFADALPVKDTGASVKSLADRLSWLGMKRTEAVLGDLHATRDDMMI